MSRQGGLASSSRHASAAQRRAAFAALLCLGFVTSPPGAAQQAREPPLTQTRSWTLTGHDLQPSQARPRAHALRLEMAFLGGTRWSPDVILESARHAVAILGQCDIHVSIVRLHEFDGPQRYRYLSTPDSREFARRSRLARPAVFFVEDTLQRPAFDAEAVGRSNAKARPEMADTVWVTSAIRDLPIALAHELVHVLADSGDHSDAPGNLMREDTAARNTQLTAAQCRTIVAVGQANGLLGHAVGDEGRR